MLAPAFIVTELPAFAFEDNHAEFRFANQFQFWSALDLGRKLGSPTPLAAAANEMMNACRGLGIDHNDFVVAHQVYRKLGGQP